MAQEKQEAQSLSMARDTGPFNERYYVRSSSWWVRPTAGLPFVQARAEVFDGVPGTTNGIFKTGPESLADNLLDMIENVERIARDHIATL
jgi:hypothetical protein